MLLYSFLEKQFSFFQLQQMLQLELQHIYYQVYACRVIFLSSCVNLGQLLYLGLLSRTQLQQILGNQHFLLVSTLCAFPRKNRSCFFFKQATQLLSLQSCQLSVLYVHPIFKYRVQHFFAQQSCCASSVYSKAYSMLQVVFFQK